MAAPPWQMDWSTSANPNADPYRVGPDPILAQRAQEEEERKRQAAAIQAAEAAAALRSRPIVDQGNLLDNKKKQRELEALTEDQRGAAKQIATLDSIVAQINDVQDLYNSGIRNESFWNAFGVLDAIGPEAGRFNSAGQGLADQGLAAFRVPGVGSQSDLEAAQFAAANTPQAGNWDAAIEQKLVNVRRRVDANRKALGLPPAQWTGLDTDSSPETRRVLPPGVAAGNPPGGGIPPSPYSDPNPRPPVFSPGNPQYDPSQGTRTENDPRMAAIGAEYRQRLGSGQSSQEIIQWLGQQGVGPQTMMQAIEQLKYREQHPEVPADRYSITTTREVPLSLYEQAVTGMGSGAAGAYALGAGNFLSGNTLDNLAPDSERARLAMDLSRAQNPNATLAGEISGGILAGMSGEAALSRLGMAPGFLRGILADTSMGAANGAGMADNGNRLSGALQGGVTAGVGSGLGAGVMKGAGRALAPSGGELRPLYNAGVRPTPGQRFANSGTAGRILNTTEEALQSVPIVGQAIRGARQEARDQFQIGAFNEALSEIGEQLPKGMRPGSDPHAFAQNAFNRVYEQARSAMQLVADEQLSSDLGQLAPDIATLGPAAQRKLKAIMANSVNNRVANGVMPGGAYKKAVADLGRHTSRLRNSPMAEDQALADVLDGVGAALDSAARRHSPPEAVQLLDAADAGYAKLVRVEEAARRRGGSAGEFSPANFDSAVQRASGGVRSKAYLRGDALMQDYARAGRSLDDTLPNSGTADRLATQVATGGAIGGGSAMGFVPTEALAMLGVIAGVYAPGVRRATKGVMAPAGPSRTAIARQLEKRARLLGRLGAASGVASLPGTAPGR